MARRKKKSTDTPAVLSRAEIRRCFRVNERTIDSWQARGRLVSVPGQPQGLSPSVPATGLFLVHDPDLRARLDGSGGRVSFALPTPMAGGGDAARSAQKRRIRRRARRSRLGQSPATPSRTPQPVARAEAHGQQRSKRMEQGKPKVARQEKQPTVRLSGQTDRVQQRKKPLRDDLLEATIDRQFPPSVPRRKRADTAPSAAAPPPPEREREQPIDAQDIDPSFALLGEDLLAHFTDDGSLMLDQTPQFGEEPELTEFDDEEVRDGEAEEEEQEQEEGFDELTEVEAEMAPEPVLASAAPPAAEVEPDSEAELRRRGELTWSLPGHAGAEDDGGEETVANLFGEPGTEDTGFDGEDYARDADWPEFDVDDGAVFDDAELPEVSGSKLSEAPARLEAVLPASIVDRLERKLDDLSSQLGPLADLAGPESAGRETGGDLQGKLDRILHELEELRSHGPYGGVEDHLQELKSNFEIAQGKRDILAGSLTMLSDDVKELRMQLGVANKAALASAKSVQTFTEHMARRQPGEMGPVAAAEVPVLQRATEAGLRPSTVVMGVGVLLLSWSLMFYLKTGNVHLALLGLVVVNLAGCATILMSRTDRD